MTKFTEQLNTTGTEIRMSDAERSRVLMALRAKMHERKPVSSPFFVRNPFFARAAVAFSLIILISGGTAFAAEGALPGDPLYAVKVSAVEPIEGVFQVSNAAKAEWNAEIATKRLEEAQALATRGTLTQSASDELAANFNEHANAVATAAQNIGGTDPASGSDISTTFSSSVATRGAAILLAGKQGMNASSAKASGSLVVAIAANEDSNTQDEAIAPAATLMKTAGTPAQATEAQAEHLSTEAHTALASARDTIAAHNLSKYQKAVANAKAAAIANRIVKADAEFSIGSTTDAVADFNRALRDINTLTQNLQSANDPRGASFSPLSH